MREHASAVYGVLLGFVDPGEADDVAQDVFLKIVQGLPSFDGRSRLGTWIYRIATNAGLNHLRTRRRRRVASSLAREGDVPSPSLSPQEELDAREEGEALARALETLPEEFRAVVVLRIQRGLSFEEIARVLGIRRPTAESRMARAKDKLRSLLGPWLDVAVEPGKERR